MARIPGFFLVFMKIFDKKVDATLSENSKKTSSWDLF